ncbi:HAD-IIIC family phosphatase [Novipirellula sp. SH528]|uniref:HAD-IIIC family phosphatase n=1 Tax=Novipirellula sp. SH528 TaxID=3454466 RepID=UPI003F9F2A4C
MMSVTQCLIVSDFNCDNLSGYLKKTSDGSIQPSCAPFGQLWPTLIDLARPGKSDKIETAIIWTQPQSIVPAISREDANLNDLFDDAMQEVDRYCDALLALESNCNTLFVPTWTLATISRGRGFADLKPGGLHWLLGKMNDRLIDRLGHSNQSFVLNASKWIEKCEGTAFDPRLWYMGKIPFHRAVFQHAAEEIAGAVDAVAGRVKKLLVLDLDDTLWGGIVGEVGWQNIRLGGHDAIGEAFKDFQKSLKRLKQQGVLLAIASKNEEAVALTAIRENPEMQLEIDDFVAWRINWNDKARNILSIVDELNIGIDSVVFIDDNPVERQRVRDTCPGVLVPDWPTDKMQYVTALSKLRCFDKASATNEDAQRTKMYHAERDRSELKHNLESVDQWLHSLDMVVEVAAVGKSNIKRATQLLNKTNQMNLSTRRLTESEFLDWCCGENREAFAFSVSDKFGDSGLTGLGSIEVVDDTAVITDFILSCRVFGRSVEDVILSTLIEAARRRGSKTIVANYVATEKNIVMLNFLENSEFSNVGNAFQFAVECDYKQPDWIQVTQKANTASAR